MGLMRSVARENGVACGHVYVFSNLLYFLRIKSIRFHSVFSWSGILHGDKSRNQDKSDLFSFSGRTASIISR